nr:MAG TPA: hypothetical protein [Caudoviricetes sp.]
MIDPPKVRENPRFRARKTSIQNRRFKAYKPNKTINHTQKALKCKGGAKTHLKSKAKETHTS